MTQHDSGAIAAPPSERHDADSTQRPASSPAGDTPKPYWGPSWLPWVFFAGWVLFMAYLLFLAIAETDRHFKAKSPFDDNSMQLKF